MTFPKRQKTEKKGTKEPAKKSDGQAAGAKKPSAKRPARSSEGEREPRKAGARGAARTGEGRASSTRGAADAAKGGVRRPGARTVGARTAGARKGEPRRGDTRHADPRKSGLRRAEPRADARHADPRKGGARRAEPRADARHADPRKGGARRAEPRADARRGVLSIDDRPKVRNADNRLGELRKGQTRQGKGLKTERHRSVSRAAVDKRGASARERTKEPRKLGARADRKSSSARPERAASTDKFAPRALGVSRFEGSEKAPKFDGRKTHARKDPIPRARAAARATDTRQGASTKLRPRVSAGAARKSHEHDLGDGTTVRVFVPLTPTPSALRRTTKPLERKRPDLGDEPHPGHFLLTTREGSEQDVIDELTLAGVVDPPPRILAPALVLAPKVPKNDKRPIELAFARQGFPIVQSVRAHDLEEISQRVSRSLRGQLEKASEYALHVWVPDSDLGNPLAAMATELEAKVVAQLAAALPDAKRVEDGALRRLGSMLFAQVCLIDPERAVAGVTYSNQAISLARGGRTRVRVTGHFPSRAARKLEEALAWLGVEPGPGELCVDLGAAPGGWTYVLADRRARVIAVDPANLKPEILAMKGVSHVKQSAFNYKPDTEVDWLFCDMAWRPLEAAALLAKWGRNRWARMVVANIKLPMTKKAEIVARVKHILATEGDWKHIRVKQLYHDRDEITLSAHVG